MVGHPSVRTFKLECLLGQLVNPKQMLFGASLRWRKGYISIWNKSKQNCGYHGNRKLPLTYDGENDVSMLASSLLIRSSSNRINHNRLRSIALERSVIKYWGVLNRVHVYTTIALGSVVVHKYTSYTYKVHMKAIYKSWTYDSYTLPWISYSVICPVWSESSLSAWRNLGSLATHWAHTEDSNQTGQMPRLIWVFAGRTSTLLVLSCRGSNSKLRHIYMSKGYFKKKKVQFLRIADK